MMPPLSSIRTICDNCGTLIDIPTVSLVMLEGKVLYEGVICPACGNILIFDGVVLQLANLRGLHQKKTKKPQKKWKIVEKGKLDTSKSRRKKR